MKVDVENQPQGMATLRIELPPEEVRKEWDSIANNYSRYARIPGYRLGKAPRQVIERKFRKEIQDELRSQYAVSYSSTNPKRDGSFRHIEIKTDNSDYRVQARAGYYATRNDAQ